MNEHAFMTWCLSRGHHLWIRYGAGVGTGPNCVLWADHEVCQTCGATRPAERVFPVGTGQEGDS